MKKQKRKNVEIKDLFKNIINDNINKIKDDIKIKINIPSLYWFLFLQGVTKSSSYKYNLLSILFQ